MVQLYHWDAQLRKILLDFLGTIEVSFRSKMLGLTKFKNDPKNVAGSLKIPHHNIISWLKSLVVLRNMCAHHSRLWNRTLHIRPIMTVRMKKLQLQPDKLGSLLYLINELSKTTGRQQAFSTEIINHLNNAPLTVDRPLGISNHGSIFN